MTASRRRYPTDLTDAQRHILAPLIPMPRPGGRPAVHQRPEFVNAMLYLARAGCAWRLPPSDLPPWQTVYHYFRCWRLEGRWRHILRVLRGRLRRRLGRRPTPSAAIIDSQSVRTTETGGPHGFDGAKKLGRPQAPPAGRHPRAAGRTGDPGRCRRP